MDSQNVKSTVWYAFGFAALTFSLLIIAVLKLFVRTLSPVLYYFLLKHLFYTQVSRKIRFLKDVSRLTLGFAASFLIVNIVTGVVSLQNKVDLLYRLGSLSTINLILLIFGGRLNFATSFLGLRLQTVSKAHSFLGWTFFGEGLLHTVLAVIWKPQTIREASRIAAIVVVSCTAAIVLSSVHRVRRHFYEIFLKTHSLLSGLVLAASWVHLWNGKFVVPPILYLLVAMVLWITFILVQRVSLIYRSFKYGAPVTLAALEIIDKEDLNTVRITVKVSRAWKFLPGQYIYLSLPRLSHYSFFQSHPFIIAWWERDVDEPTNYSIVLLVQVRSGFTNDLLLHTIANKPDLLALIEGPYGGEIPLRDYGTAILFATGIGIAGQLPYVKQILEDHRDGRARTQKVVLFWELESQRHLDWVQAYMNELLMNDTGYALSINLYFPNEKIDRYKTTLGKHKRIQLQHKCLDAPWEVVDQVNSRKGKAIITTCVHHKMRRDIRLALRDHLSQEVYLEELEFHPQRIQNMEKPPPLR